MLGFRFRALAVLGLRGWFSSLRGGNFFVSEKRWGSGIYGLSGCFIGVASMRKLARVVQKHGEFGEH